MVGEFFSCLHLKGIELSITTECLRLKVPFGIQIMFPMKFAQRCQLQCIKWKASILVSDQQTLGLFQNVSQYHFWLYLGAEWWLEIKVVLNHPAISDWIPLDSLFQSCDILHMKNVKFSGSFVISCHVSIAKDWNLSRVNAIAWAHELWCHLAHCFPSEMQFCPWMAQRTFSKCC